MGRKSAEIISRHELREPYRNSSTWGDTSKRFCKVTRSCTVSSADGSAPHNWQNNRTNSGRSSEKAVNLVSICEMYCCSPQSAVWSGTKSLGKCPGPMELFPHTAPPCEFVLLAEDVLKNFKQGCATVAVVVEVRLEQARRAFSHRQQAPPLCF